MTGLTEAEFMALLPHFEYALLAYMQDRTIDGQPRTSRRYSTYDTCPLPTTADKLLFILTYLKQNPIQEVQGQLFGMSQPNANKWIHLLHSVLNQALADQERLPARTADDLVAMLTTPQIEVCPSSLFFTMGPNDQSSVRKTRRSSKSITVVRRNAHTLKNLLVIDQTCHVCFLSHTCEGKASDKSIAELAGYTLPPGSCLYQDKGFQGFFLHGITIVQPKKTPRGGELPRLRSDQSSYFLHQNPY